MCCLMNLLWLLLGGIFTAVEYLISSLLMMLTNYRHSFWDANIEVGRTCFMAFR